MFFNYNKYSYYIKPGVTDMRKGYISLIIDIRENMHLDPFSPSMFLFCSKDKKTIAVIVWEDNGFWIMKKRLQEGTYSWPKDEEEALKVTIEDTKRILRGEGVFRRLKAIDKGYNF